MIVSNIGFWVSFVFDVGSFPINLKKKLKKKYIYIYIKKPPKLPIISNLAF